MPREDVTLISASHEHFYLPEFHILAKELERYGISLNIATEPLQPGIGRLVIDFPFLFRSPSSTISELGKAYKDGSITFLLPPKPFLGSKMILAWVHNPQETLQEKICTYVDENYIKRLQQFIPPTFLVNKRKGEAKPFWYEYAEKYDCVLKACISSGAKQVYFPEESDYWETLTNACNANYSFVLQHAIRAKRCPIRYFGRQGNIIESHLYCRFTAYFSKNGLIDLRVVARENKKVHGAPDAVQLGVVIDVVK
jgi:hypothetical protein